MSETAFSLPPEELAPKEKRTPSLQSIYARLILGTNEIPKAPDQMPPEISLNKTMLGQMSEAIKLTGGPNHNGDGKERFQLFGYYKNTQQIVVSDLQVGEKENTGEHWLPTIAWFKKMYGGVLQFYHTHPQGKFVLSGGDTINCLFNYGGFLEISCAENGIMGLAHTQKSLKSSNLIRLQRNINHLFSDTDTYDAGQNKYDYMFETPVWESCLNHAYHNKTAEQLKEEGYDEIYVEGAIKLNSLLTLLKDQGLAVYLWVPDKTGNTAEEIKNGITLKKIN